MEADGYTCPPEFSRGGRSASPPRVRMPAMSDQPAAHDRIDEMGRSVASLQEYVEMERARRMEWEHRRREREEARRAEEEARRAEEERLARKAEKQRKQEEEKMAMAKVVELQLSLRLGGICEDIRAEVRQAVTATVARNPASMITEQPAKGKEKAAEDVPSSSGLQAKSRLSPKAPSSSLSRISGRGPARDLVMERMVYLDQTRRDLSKLDYDRLRAICRNEDVNYTTKVQSIFDIADRRALLRYGEALPEPEPFVNLDNVDRHSSPEGSGDEVRGHVRFRLREMSGLSLQLVNANNVPKAQRNDRLVMLGSEISDAFNRWTNAKGQSVSCSLQELSGCMTACRMLISGGLDRREVFALKTRLDGLVLTPLDRNPSEILVIGPLLYYEGMMSLFIRNEGYVPVEGKVVTVLEAMKADLQLDGLTEFACWDKKGPTLVVATMKPPCVEEGDGRDHGDDGNDGDEGHEGGEDDDDDVGTRREGGVEWAS
ncbi:hypothetical protein CBR_g40375 [Chara braunii]|uniref:Uncharacterized protein n=1 Tax=Chara braunii TaxID=69332 RepID=A0A388LTK3_CHABU|nr:hypothetical protein CBR_g40375 [Chara braunii]|eukprot:GBG85646.1 hypothetical protein CBR_g40375 [Chara braunii]